MKIEAGKQYEARCGAVIEITEIIRRGDDYPFLGKVVRPSEGYQKGDMKTFTPHGTYHIGEEHDLDLLNEVDWPYKPKGSLYTHEEVTAILRYHGVDVKLLKGK